MAAWATQSATSSASETSGGRPYDYGEENVESEQEDESPPCPSLEAEKRDVHDELEDTPTFDLLVVPGNNVYTDVKNVHDLREARQVSAKTVRAGTKPVQKKVQTAKRARSAPSTTPHEVCLEVLNIREARAHLPQIVSSVAAGSSSVAIGPRGEPTAAIVSYQWACGLLTPGAKKRKLALLVVDELLPDAPPHLKMPAVDELSRLPMRDLDVLWRIDRLPSGTRELAMLQAKLAHPDVLVRLVRRSEVATAIKRAREAGVYDMAEDATSDVLADIFGVSV
jgi:antitoxin (DNA-binding transcriptional repressor) of toxin-antitoxin stability system